MSDFLKPQSPLQHKDGAYVYPLTTADQVILEDNSRLNTAFENLVYVSEEKQETAIVPVDADTLGGKSESELSVLRAIDATNAENATNATNANTIGGYSVNSLISKIYPVGSIYMSVNSTSPSTLFGGTWVQLKDRFLLGAGDTYSAGATGGEATHKLTVKEMPSHSHEFFVNIQHSDGQTTSGESLTSGLQGGGRRRYVDTTKSIGGSNAHNNMPPYLAVYMWKRTA